VPLDKTLVGNEMLVILVDGLFLDDFFLNPLNGLEKREKEVVLCVCC